MNYSQVEEPRRNLDDAVATYSKELVKTVELLSVQADHLSDRFLAACWHLNEPIRDAMRDAMSARARSDVAAARRADTKIAGEVRVHMLETLRCDWVRTMGGPDGK